MYERNESKSEKRRCYTKDEWNGVGIGGMLVYRWHFCLQRVKRNLRVLWINFKVYVLDGSLKYMLGKVRSSFLKGEKQRYWILVHLIG